MENTKNFTLFVFGTALHRKRCMKNGFGELTFEIFIHYMYEPEFNNKHYHSFHVPDMPRAETCFDKNCLLVEIVFLVEIVKKGFGDKGWD